MFCLKHKKQFLGQRVYGSPKGESNGSVAGTRCHSILVGQTRASKLFDTRFVRENKQNISRITTPRSRIRVASGEGRAKKRPLRYPEG